MHAGCGERQGVAPGAPGDACALDRAGDEPAACEGALAVEEAAVLDDDAAQRVGGRLLAVRAQVRQHPAGVVLDLAVLEREGAREARAVEEDRAPQNLTYF